MATPDVILSRLVLCHTQILGSYLVSAQAGVLRDALTVHLHLYKFFKCRSMILFFSRNTVFCSDVRMSIKKKQCFTKHQTFQTIERGKMRSGKKRQEGGISVLFSFPRHSFVFKACTKLAEMNSRGLYLLAFILDISLIGKDLPVYQFFYTSKD